MHVWILHGEIYYNTLELDKNRLTFLSPLLLPELLPGTAEYSGLSGSVLKMCTLARGAAWFCGTHAAVHLPRKLEAGAWNDVTFGLTTFQLLR